MTEEFHQKKRSSIPKTVRDLSQEQLRDMLIKKRKCNDKAQQIVEALLEPKIDTKWLLENLQHINQCHYEDVTVERSILIICGYPLCSNPLRTVPKKQYQISYSRKEIYDASIKFKFCCVNCWRASDFLKAQLLTSPLWFRDNEIIPTFTILDTKTPIPTRNDVSHGKLNVDTNFDAEEGKESEKVIKKVDDKTMNMSTNAKKEPPITTKNLNPVKKVENCVDEWFTVSTLIHLLGEDTVRQLFKDKKQELQKALDNYLPSDSNVHHASRLFSLLNLTDSEIRTDLKPVPDYSVLKKDTEGLTIKYRSFMSGQLTLEHASGTETATEQQSENSDSFEMPLVDSHAQLALRRRVLFDRIINVVKNIGQTIGVESYLTVSNVRELIKHFKLDADNVTFNPAESTLVALILIRLLTEKIGSLKQSFNLKSVTERTTLILLNYGLPGNYLDNVKEWLCDTNAIIRKLGGQ